MHAVVLLAAPAGGGGGGLDPTVLLQYGAVGFLAIAGMYVSATLYKRVLNLYERERQRADRLESELRTLNQTTQELTMQALKDATAAVAEALEAVVDPTKPPRARRRPEAR